MTLYKITCGFSPNTNKYVENVESFDDAELTKEHGNEYIKYGFNNKNGLPVSYFEYELIDRYFTYFHTEYFNITTATINEEKVKQHMIGIKQKLLRELTSRRDFIDVQIGYINNTK